MDPIAELIAQDIADDPPPGFHRIPIGGGFNLFIGAIYGRVRDGKLALGMRIKPRLLNPHQTLHGGVVACFADMQAYVAQREGGVPDHLTPTISMSIDYLEPIVSGNWLQADTSLLKATRNLLFTQTVGAVADRPVFRSSCVYKIGPKSIYPGSTLAGFFESLEEKS
ncbi:PaaI family thioesterase [Mesorhizobium microcysteis]|uniref:PaaI family thioesterase n=1 Tax=Neoaquamicrobium microcysteis TaxID=2682781 RepID=A0A5D4H1J1_9HYPH|nr:PaaI family thioesterase [Mesorhizobium microcysteis]TYR33385.1 PaaI family thioesterase [Mesorhizobium microcysteis]